ncbi:MAG: UDP-N-acetylglucosamine 1-carboxyvinyltransferase [Firmicutes bacterium]|nr:UDP-N-acetylglucosamine 1-carboxyvinyltransferase [Bacillota bacterium]
MTELIINGGRRLSGSVRIGGAKNAAVAIIPAALLGNGESVIENLPGITDVHVYADILKTLGAVIRWEGSTLHIAPNGFAAYQAPYELVKRLRASYYLWGVLLAKFGRAEVALPGGDDIGLRLVDQHLKGFRALGAEVQQEHGLVILKARELVGTSIYLDVTSVGATVNIMLAATLASGTTILENAAKEPHIVDLANFLNSMGARIQGAGTDTIKIKGVRQLRGTTYSIIPDSIEAATYLLAGIATGGSVTVENVIPKHLEPVCAKIREVGAEVIEGEESLQVIARGRPQAVNIKTLPYPGFPTDAHPPFASVLSRAEGISVIHETVHDSRFAYAKELVRMGANIRVDGRMAIMEGMPTLSGTEVKAVDLRAGASLIVAGLIAEGETRLRGVEHVDRGYERVEEKLRTLGAEVNRVAG